MKEKMSFWRNGVKLSKDQLNIAIRNIKYDVYPCETKRYKINKASDNTYAVWKKPSLGNKRGFDIFLGFLTTGKDAFFWTNNEDDVVERFINDLFIKKC